MDQVFLDTFRPPVHKANGPYAPRELTGRDIFAYGDSRR